MSVFFLFVVVNNELFAFNFKYVNVVSCAAMNFVVFKLNNFICICFLFNFGYVIIVCFVVGDIVYNLCLFVVVLICCFIFKFEKLYIKILCVKATIILFCCKCILCIGILNLSLLMYFF